MKNPFSFLSKANKVRQTPTQQSSPPEMSIEQKVARFNEIFATDSANRTEEETRLIKELAPQVNEYMKKKILGQLDMKTEVITQIKNTVPPTEKVPAKENERDNTHAFLDEWHKNELIVRTVEISDEGKKLLLTFDESGEALYSSQFDDNTEFDDVELFDENGDSVTFNTVGRAAFKEVKYLIVTPRLKEKLADDEAIEVLIMKEVSAEGEEIEFEEVTDKALYERIFSTFKKAYEYFN